MSDLEDRRKAYLARFQPTNDDDEPVESLHLKPLDNSITIDRDHVQKLVGPLIDNCEELNRQTEESIKRRTKAIEQKRTEVENDCALGNHLWELEFYDIDYYHDNYYEIRDGHQVTCKYCYITGTVAVQINSK